MHAGPRAHSWQAILDGTTPRQPMQGTRDGASFSDKLREGRGKNDRIGECVQAAVLVEAPVSRHNGHMLSIVSESMHAQLFGSRAWASAATICTRCRSGAYWAHPMALLTAADHRACVSRPWRSQKGAAAGVAEMTSIWRRNLRETWVSSATSREP